MSTDATAPRPKEPRPPMMGDGQTQTAGAPREPRSVMLTLRRWRRNRDRWWWEGQLPDDVTDLDMKRLWAWRDGSVLRLRFSEGLQPIDDKPLRTSCITQRQTTLDDWWKWFLRGVAVIGSLLLITGVSIMVQHESKVNLECLRRGYAYSSTHWTPAPVSFCVGSDAVLLE